MAGFAMLALLVAVKANASSVLVPPPAPAYAYYNDGGFSTSLVLVNNTSKDIEISSDEPGWGCGSYCVKPKVKAYSFTRSPLTNPGAGVKKLVLPAGLEAYTAITSPLGAEIRVPALEARESNIVYDLDRAGAYNGGLFIAAETDSVVQVAGGEAFKLKAGEGKVTYSPGPVAVVQNYWSVGGVGTVSGRLYVFGFLNHQLTGSLQAIPSR